jgi:hypothetical protein
LNTVLSVLMLAAMALAGGAAFLWRRGGSRKQIGLMLLLAAIMVINVGIWTLPDASGNAPLGRALD